MSCRSPCPIEPVPLEADAARLEQILANLLNNAAKYTEPGGRIASRSDARRDEAVVRVARQRASGSLPELLPRVFDLFTQADRSLDRSQGGLGIGLTLVRRLVELHGGSVAASAKARAGAASSSSGCPWFAPTSTGGVPDDDQTPTPGPIGSARAEAGARRRR